MEKIHNGSNQRNPERVKMSEPGLRRFSDYHDGTYLLAIEALDPNDRIRAREKYLSELDLAQKKLSFYTESYRRILTGLLSGVNSGDCNENTLNERFVGYIRSKNRIARILPELEKIDPKAAEAFRKEHGLKFFSTSAMPSVSEIPIIINALKSAIEITGTLAERNRKTPGNKAVTPQQLQGIFAGLVGNIAAKQGLRGTTTIFPGGAGLAAFERHGRSIKFDLAGLVKESLKNKPNYTPPHHTSAPKKTAWWDQLLVQFRNTLKENDIRNTARQQPRQIDFSKINTPKGFLEAIFSLLIQANNQGMRKGTIRLR